MSDDDTPPENNAGPSIPSGALSRELPIINKRGLHARASAKFVQMVERFNAEIWVTRGNETVGGTSIMGLMMLAAGPGTSIVVSAAGPEAEAALNAITELVGDKFPRRKHVTRTRRRAFRIMPRSYFAGGTM